MNAHLADLTGTLARMDGKCALVQAWGMKLATVLESGGRLLACGNGGSAAEAQHLTAELVGRFKKDRRPFAAIPLHADGSSVTAIANDFGIEEVYARQVRAHGRTGDVLITLSCSGTSPNVLAAARAAQQTGLLVWALTGPAPNALAELSDEVVAVPSPDTSIVQEVHLVLIHMLCSATEEALT
ncbi:MULTISPECIES: SIS domain-containing protein [Streptosporangium]|uniref:SIS domain-containing protein n=1 Tax=Streptosporangium longisporum TaxID=46187 RepID=A0ABP6L9M6_9ACTN